MTAGWGVRTVRAAVFAAVCVLLAALGHVLMSGVPVPWWAMAGGGVATAAAGWALAGRERGLAVVVTVVVVAQTVLHEAFSLAQSALPGAAPAPGGAAAGGTGSGAGGLPRRDPMAHDMGSMDTMPTGSMSLDHMALDHVSLESMDLAHTHHLGHSTPDTSSFGMLAAHLLAALLCGLWLAHGERAAFRILRAVAGRLAAPLRLLAALPTPPHRPRLCVRPRSERAPRRLLIVLAITSRGPPVGTAVA
ncbi:hypothetical protein [Streptomyces fructofermentans]|uniref:Integral-membrane protein n=1 Tax=Streptomyces fructofermentans TaxID=152141 RepID=A0A918KI63_9ACTN|nr:hypothetical protein [Streptomyces fructofermentans]GGX62627.1 hypothetical protein GCM10010515_32860 [Streptomyces fructofermentans]